MNYALYLSNYGKAINARALAYPVGDFDGGPPFAVDPDEPIALLSV